MLVMVSVFSFSDLPFLYFTSFNFDLVPVPVLNKRYVYMDQNFISNLCLTTITWNVYGSNVKGSTRIICFCF